VNNKIVVVYQDTKGRCRVLVNPANMDKYLNKDNVAINPPIESLLAEGATPDRWYIEGGQIHVNAEKSKANVSELDIYDLFLDVMDKKEELEKWLSVKESQIESLSNDIVTCNGRLNRLNRYLSKLKKRASVYLLLVTTIFFIVVGVCLLS
jgi:hypothetical protein